MQWWHGTQGRQEGPVAEEELRAMIAAGQLGPQTMVWREGLPAWQPLTAFPELCGAQQGLAGYGSPVAPTSGLAIASLVCGIVSLFLCYFSGVAAIPAVVCGHLALKRIRESVVPTGGRGLAVAGLVTGYLGVLAQVASVAFFGFFFFGMMRSTSVMTPHSPTLHAAPSVSPPVATPPTVPAPGSEEEEEEPAEEEPPAEAPMPAEEPGGHDPAAEETGAEQP
jgi:hypothetical protein